MTIQHGADARGRSDIVGGLAIVDLALGMVAAHVLDERRERPTGLIRMPLSR